jgi:hypothetical protein
MGRPSPFFFDYAYAFLYDATYFVRELIMSRGYIEDYPIL